MKYLTDYTEKKLSELFKEYGAFFAFSDKQYDEKAVKGVAYVSLYGGLICPREHAKILIKKIHECHIEDVKTDLEENGKETIIKRELYNHEAFCVYSIVDTVECLKSYDITVDEIQKVFADELPQLRG